MSLSGAWRALHNKDTPLDITQDGEKLVDISVHGTMRQNSIDNSLLDDLEEVHVVECIRSDSRSWPFFVHSHPGMLSRNYFPEPDRRACC
jgi:hypothetical protein